jgi:hypothetical protein
MICIDFSASSALAGVDSAGPYRRMHQRDRRTLLTSARHMPGFSLAWPRI